MVYFTNGNKKYGYHTPGILLIVGTVASTTL